MFPSQRDAQTHANASRLARLARDQRQAPRAAEARQHALEAVGLPAPGVAAIAAR